MASTKEIARDYLINCGWYKEHNITPPDYTKVFNKDFEKIPMQEGGKNNQDIKAMKA